jgi:hypothetical protein
MYKNSIGYFGSLVYECTKVKYKFIKINGIMKYLEEKLTCNPSIDSGNRGF